MALNDDFEKAIKDIQGLPEMPSNQDQLALYALFKQARFGDVTGTRPPQFELFDRAKFAQKICQLEMLAARNLHYPTDGHLHGSGQYRMLSDKCRRFQNSDNLAERILKVGNML